MPDIPESLLRRSAEAKAKALGVPVEQVLAEMKGEAPPTTPTPPAEPPEAPKPQPGASAHAAHDEEPQDEVEAGAEVPGTPEEPEAEPVAAEAETEQAAAPVATMTEELPPVSETAGDGSGNGSGNGKMAAMVSPRPVATPSGTPEGVRTQRLLTVVKARAIQQVKSDPTDKVNTWPHLMLAEFGALLAMTALLVILSTILQAPLLAPANFNLTPNPSKAPWYFLGLQELLSYFDPQIAGVTVPTIIGLLGFMMIPYVDRNPSTKPSDRKFAIMLYTIFLAGAATLTMLGVLFRAEGFNFAYPWKAGIFFDDLKDWVHFEGGH